MNNRNLRQTFFVCANVSNGNLVTQVISAVSPTEATKIFEQKYACSPKQIMGPFYKKRACISETARILKFSNEYKKAHYNDWLVNAFMLKEPADHAYLVFIRRLDDKKIPSPTGTIIVPLAGLRFI